VAGFVFNRRFPLFAQSAVFGANFDQEGFCDDFWGLILL
jgi:hypothetical protein